VYNTAATKLNCDDQRINPLLHTQPPG